MKKKSTATAINMDITIDKSQEMSIQPLMQSDALTLPASPSLSDFQQYVIKLKKMRGFKDNKKNALIFLFNEVGELGQAMSKCFALDDTSPLPDEKQKAIKLEMADIFIYLLDLANQHGICLEQAFREKEEINKQRIWSSHHRA